MTPNLRLTPPLLHGLRGVDAYGDGAYGASRDGGTREHLGIDFVGTPGESVVCPCRATLTWVGYAYPDSKVYRSIHLRSLDEPDLLLTLLYVDPKDDKSGEEYMPGDAIGSLQNLQDRYPADALHPTPITPHTHVYAYWKAKLFDPTDLFFPNGQ